MTTQAKPTTHIVCFSKGHSSAIVAIEVVRRYGKENVVLLNHDINPGVEDADIKRFGQQVADYLGLPITYANIDGITDPEQLPDQFDVALQESAFKQPGTGNALCTTFLKTKPFYDYLNTHHPDQNVVIYYGFDQAEVARKVRREAVLGKDGWETAFPLIDTPSDQRTIFGSREIGIEPPLTYSAFKHANCSGCLKGGIQHWYVVYCTRPDVYAKASATEPILGYSILTDRSGGTRTPLWLADAAKLFERMKCAGVPATEHYDTQLFKKQLKRYGIESPQLFMPCECVI